MADRHTVTAYIDYKSPYAYLAKDLAYQLERDFGVEVDWLPYVLDIPSFLGSARVDDSGRVIEEERNAHQWRRVRYSYMDCRTAEDLTSGKNGLPRMCGIMSVLYPDQRLREPRPPNRATV